MDLGVRDLGRVLSAKVRLREAVRKTDGWRTLGYSDLSGL